ncbi:MAG: ATP-dependent helicase [Patescibacteria group bacterium]|nr:DEAD/DEAH box helicase [Patescibacteria group bacterium]MDE1945946.1 ATP-dependent helicase [Patescibacteria group bacterium]
MTFEERYRGLNAAQKRAVDAIEGPVMVIAGPGTGKTTILTMRIANILLRTDTPPSGILAITYTSAGVKAVRENLRNIIGGRADEVAIHTFHDFASAMMAEYQDHFLHMKDARPASDVETESLIRDILIEPEFAELRPAGRPDAFLEGIIRSIDEAKRDALTPDMVASFAAEKIEKIKNDESSISTRGKSKGQLKTDALEQIGKCERTKLFAGAYAEYEKRKREKKMLDFNDLIIEFLAVLRTDALFLRLLQERFLSILVDEHQDTNDAQNAIVAILAEFFDTPNIFIVGDEKQAIYRFQGASVENFMRLREKYPAMQVINLEKNYRSRRGILDASFAMIEQNYAGDEHAELRIRLESNRADESDSVVVATAENAAAMEQYLVSELQKISANEPRATVAVITRRNRELERVVRLLESEGVAVSSERSIDIFKHPVGAIFFDLLEYLSDKTRLDALAKTAAGGLWAMPLSEAADFARTIRSGKPVEIEEKLSSLQEILRKESDDDPIGFLITAARESGFADLAARDPAYVYVWRGIMTLAETLVRDRALVSPDDLMRAMLDYRRSAESKAIKISVGAPDAQIRAMTAHGSKGLEFDYVFLPYATEEAWVSRARGAHFVLPKKQAARDDIRDTRRLFYVALTRAKERVTIMIPLEESDGTAFVPVRFINELGTDHVGIVRLPRADVSLPAEEKALPRSSAVTDLAKHVLLTSGLSVTALNHFLENPADFLKESILKLPQAPSVPSEKGSAMHYALEHVWQLEEKTETNIARTLEEKIIEYVNESFLPSREKEIAKKDLVADAPAVARALLAHFQTHGIVRTEYWIESFFESAPDGEKVRIPLHGKLDAVIEEDGMVSVFDYKTRESMSLAEIRGETKNSNGNYLRQLAFYALLLSGDPRWRMKKRETSLVFVSPDKKGRCPIVTIPITPADIEKLRGEIETLIDFVWSGKLPESVY